MAAPDETDLRRKDDTEDFDNDEDQEYDPESYDVPPWLQDSWDQISGPGEPDEGQAVEPVEQRGVKPLQGD